MNINMRAFEEKLDQFITSTIPAEDISVWAHKAAYELLQSGKVFELSYLPLFKMLSLVADAYKSHNTNIYEEACQVREIINANANYSNITYMKLPNQPRELEISRIRETLLGYRSKGFIETPDAVVLRGFCERYCEARNDEIVTLQDLLALRASDFLLSSYSFDTDIGKMYFRPKNSILINNPEAFQNVVLSRIMETLNSCVGDDIFAVRISFINGISSVSLL